MWKKGLRDFFIFPRHERRGVAALALLLALAWLLPYFSERKTMPSDGVEWRRVQAADSLRVRSHSGWLRSGQSNPSSRSPRPHRETYLAPARILPFDPNSATEEDWLSMGLTVRQAGTIHNYVSKGGRFRKAEDLKRIYGFPREAYVALAPHVRIPAALPYSHRESSPSVARKERWPDRPRRHPGKVGINTADSASWESLPGIGPSLASRIVRFRDRLGGFHNTSQVAETYGLPDSVFRRIEPFLIAEPHGFEAGLDVNEATVERLKTHPYMTYRLARSIVAYREQHGKYRNIEDLLSIETMTPDLFNKLRPYLSLR